MLPYAETTPPSCISFGDVVYLLHSKERWGATKFRVWIDRVQPICISNIQTDQVMKSSLSTPQFKKYQISIESQRSSLLRSSRSVASNGALRHPSCRITRKISRRHRSKPVENREFSHARQPAYSSNSIPEERR